MKPIKETPEHNRPREMLRERGVSALTDDQLVMAIIGSGGRGFDVVSIARAVAKLIREQKGDLSLDHLSAVHGMGLAKSAQILSAFELARRYLIKNKIKISSASDALPLLAEFSGKNQEHFVCISLNGANEVIETRIVTIGLVNSSQIHPREVFADVLKDRASSVIFAHNHPSGDLNPSKADTLAQKQLVDAAEILGIRVLDHIIVSTRGYYSFQESGLI